jgi:hypothetical protein
VPTIGMRRTTPSGVTGTADARASTTWSAAASSSTSSASRSTPATRTRSRTPSSMQCFAVATSHGASTTAPAHRDGSTSTVAAPSILRTEAGTGGGFACAAVTSQSTSHAPRRRRFSRASRAIARAPGCALP